MGFLVCNGRVGGAAAVSCAVMLGSVAHAQDGISFYACVDNQSLHEAFEAVNGRSKPTHQDMLAIETRCTRNYLRPKSTTISLDIDADANGNDVLVLWAVDDYDLDHLVPLSKVLDRVVLEHLDRKNGTVVQELVAVGPYGANEYVDIIDLGTLSPILDDSVVALRLDRNGTHFDTRYFEMHTPFTLYGKGGFWLPVGLFSTDFGLTENGLPLNLMPVGLAWGGRVNVSGHFYLGTSLVGSWSISAAPTDQEVVNLANLSPSLLFDINDIVYLGANVTVGFTDGQSTVSGVGLVIGPTPKLMGLVKGAR